MTFERVDLSQDVTLYRGDCLQIMPTLQAGSVSVITDPPYGVSRDKGFGGFGGFGKPIARTHYKGDWDKDRPGREYFIEMLRVSNLMLCFGGNFFTDFLPVSQHWIVWDKRQTMPSFGDCELVWTNVNRKSVKIITKEWNGLLGKEDKRFHATQKPEKIMLWLIHNYTQPDDLILDPFMGSGTTGVAAVKLGRKFIGIEIDPNYFEIARRRIEEALAQPPLFRLDAGSSEKADQQTLF